MIEVFLVRLDSPKTGQVGSDASQKDSPLANNLFNGLLQNSGQKAFPQITHFHHEDDLVRHTGFNGKPGERFDDRKLRVEADIGILHGRLGLARCGAPQQDKLGLNSSLTHPLDVLQPRIGEGVDSRSHEDVSNCGISTYDLCHTDDADAFRCVDLPEARSVVRDLFEIDLDPRCRHHAAVRFLNLSSGKTSRSRPTIFSQPCFKTSIVGSP